MALFTEDMTRLWGEITTARKARESFLKQLGEETRERKVAVSEMQATFNSLRTTQTRKARADLAGFVSGLRCEVGRRRRELRVDLAGGRRAWGPAVLIFEKRRTAPQPQPDEKSVAKSAQHSSKKAR